MFTPGLGLLPVEHRSSTHLKNIHKSVRKNFSEPALERRPVNTSKCLSSLFFTFFLKFFETSVSFNVCLNFSNTFFICFYTFLALSFAHFLHSFWHFLCTFCCPHFFVYFLLPTFFGVLFVAYIFAQFLAPFLLHFWNLKGVVPLVLKQVANLSYFMFKLDLNSTANAILCFFDNKYWLQLLRTPFNERR